MGVVTDKSLQGLTTAVTNISATGMSDNTGQAINTTLQSLVEVIRPSSNAVSTGITGVTAYKCGNIVQLTINRTATASSSGWFEFGILPDELIPIATILTAAFDNNISTFASSHYTNLRVSNTGSLSVWLFSDKLSMVIATTITYLV